MNAYNTEEKQNSQSVIQISNLVKKFRVGQGYQTVLDHINLNIFSTDFTIIYGPSGCGKSTLLNVMCGLEPPTSGKVYVRNIDVYQMRENERAAFRAKKFGIVYQMSYWLKSLTVLENVAMPLLVQGVSSDYAYHRADECLQKVALAKFANYIPTELSGGQQQRVSVARALVTSPWIIIADEPTGNLDSQSAGELVELFLHLNKELKRTIIMVTHNMAYLGYATRRIAMKDGQIQETRNLEEMSELFEIIRPGVMRRRAMAT